MSNSGAVHSGSLDRYAACCSSRSATIEDDRCNCGPIGGAGWREKKWHRPRPFHSKPVPGGQERLKEAAKHGFKRAIVPKANLPKHKIAGIEIIGVNKVTEALEAL